MKQRAEVEAKKRLKGSKPISAATLSALNEKTIRTAGDDFRKHGRN
jgi:hypothetical protein